MLDPSTVGNRMDARTQARPVMHWVGIGFAMGGALFHGTNATILRIVWVAPGYLPAGMFFAWMAGIALLVVGYAVNDRRGHAIVKRSFPAVAWYPIFFLVLIFSSGLYMPFFYGPIIFFSCAAGHWFIAHERREDASLGRRRAAMVIVAALVASSPVMVDRLFFRPLSASTSTITRAVTGPDSLGVIATVEGSNVSAGVNWSTILPGEDHFAPYFSGALLATYTRWIRDAVTFDNTPILYSTVPNKRLEYSLTGGLVTGNITFTYTNQTLRCKVNGSSVVEYSTEGFHEPEPIQLFMNASLHPVPAAAPVSVTLTNAYVVHLHAQYDEYCGSLCGYYGEWDQWYIVRPGSGIDWAVVTTSNHAIS